MSILKNCWYGAWYSSQTCLFVKDTVLLVTLRVKSVLCWGAEFVSLDLCIVNWSQVSLWFVPICYHT